MRCGSCVLQPAFRRLRCSPLACSRTTSSGSAGVRTCGESSDTTTLGVVLTRRSSNLVVTSTTSTSSSTALAQLGGSAQNTLNLCYLGPGRASDFCQAVIAARQVRSRCRTRSICAGEHRSPGHHRLDLGALWLGCGLRHGRWQPLRHQTQWTFTDKFTITPMQAVPANKNRRVGAYGSTCGEPIPESKGVTRSLDHRSFGRSLRHRFIDSVTPTESCCPGPGCHVQRRR
jgi:hypothetical protein